MSHQYNTADLTLPEIEEVLHRAKKLCTDYWVDVLDCSKSFARQKTSMSFDEFMEDKFGNYPHHFTIIHRNTARENHIEVCYNTLGPGPSYFLYLILPPDSVVLDKDICQFCEMPIHNCVCSHED